MFDDVHLYIQGDRRKTLLTLFQKLLVTSNILGSDPLGIGFFFKYFFNTVLSRQKQ